MMEKMSSILDRLAGPYAVLPIHSNAVANANAEMQNILLVYRFGDADVKSLFDGVCKPHSNLCRPLNAKIGRYAQILFLNYTRSVIAM
jgi:hypothetical protein